MDRRALKTQFVPDDMSIFSTDELLDFEKETRRVAVWNRRAALLRAGDAGADATFIDTEVSALERAFQNENWMESGDAAAHLDPVTPLPTGREVARLAKANNDAAQRVATIALASQLVDVATTLLNIANGRVPQSPAQASFAERSPLPERVEPTALARGEASPVFIGIGIGLLAVLAGASTAISMRRGRR